MTRVRTVLKRVTPDVPAGAFLPSKHQTLALTSFTIKGGNIGCSLSGVNVRCALLRKVWTAPAQPQSCNSAYGDAIDLTGKGLATFSCGGMAKPPANGKIVPDGWDDKIGGYTCQVRSFGIDCFAASHSGFFLSRTGYTIY